MEEEAEGKKQNMINIIMYIHTHILTQNPIRIFIIIIHQ